MEPDTVRFAFSFFSLFFLKLTLRIVDESLFGDEIFRKLRKRLGLIGLRLL